MPYANEDLAFHKLESSVQAAFNTNLRLPTKVLLPAGMKLYKFNHYNSLVPPGVDYLSPWWSAYDRYSDRHGNDDAGWVQKEKMAKLNGVNVREWGRLTSAVSEDWNSLDYLLVISLKVAIYGVFGGFASQPRVNTTKTKNSDGSETTTNKISLRNYSRDGVASSKEGAAATSKRLPGGASQIYIPNLHKSQAQLESITMLP